MLGLGLALPDAAVRVRRAGAGGSGADGGGADGGGADGGGGALAVSRPPFAMAEAWNLWGDSTTFGVGAPAGADYPQALRALALAGGGGPTGVACHLGAAADGTRSFLCNGGVAAENSGSIAARVTALANGAHAAEMTRPQIFSGGLNNYNSGVAGWSRNWPAQVIADLATQVARIGGGKDWFHILAPAEDGRCDGMVEGAAHVHHRREMTAAHGRHILNFQRYARDHADVGAATGYDAIATTITGAIPASLRGTSSSAATPAYNDAAPVVVAGAPTDLSHAEGQFAWNSAAQTMYRKLGASGGGSWQPIDTKHFSSAGYALMARMVADAMLASAGSGPPLAAPQEFLTTIDAPAGGVVGRLAHTGVATGFALTTDRAGNNPATAWAIGADGSITRTGAAGVSEGMRTLYAWASNGHGTLRSTVDLYVDKPAAAPPGRFTVGGTGIALYGRESHAMPNGRQIAGAMLVKVDQLSTAPFLINLIRGPAGQTSFAVKVLADGRISFVGNNNSASATLGVNLSTAAGNGIAAGAWTWILFSLDFAGGAASVWFNDSPKATGAFPGSGAAGGTFNFADTSPMFYAARPPQQFDDGLNVLKGGFGPLLLFAGAVDWSAAQNRRALFDAGGLPAARAPFSAVGGVVPRFDTSAGLGGLLWGVASPADAQTLLVPSWRARALVGAAA